MYRCISFILICMALAGCSPDPAASDPVMTTPVVDIYTTASAGDYATASQFIASGQWDYNVANYEGKLPLHCAIEGGSADLVTLMVQNGADPMNPDVKGRTPLQYAQELGKDDIAAVLQQLGATR